MARVKGVYKRSDYPGVPDEATKKDLDDLFEYIFPGEPDPAFVGSRSPWAIMTAQGPRLPLLIAKLGDHLKAMPWCQRRDLRELAFQTTNLHFRCDFSFQAHLGVALDVGLGHELLAAIPYWRTTNLFDEEQRLVIEYTFAVVAGDVPDELFSRVVKKYGEKGTIEFTTAIAFWSFWAMINNATRPEFDLGHLKPRAAK